MSLSLERLQVLLKEEDARKETQRQAREARTHETVQVAASIQAAWQALGVLSPVKGLWTRPIPPTLYTCPLSQPQTTLVPWKSLPLSVRNKLTATEPADLDGVVQVPTAYLVQQDQAAGEETGVSASPGANGSNLSKRPVSGNLTNKLSEYTRGISGQSRPFRPGGIDTTTSSAAAAADGEASDVHHHQDVYRTPEATLRAMQVLDKGSEASWKDGTILTAPPGADFKAGLTWNDIHGGNTAEDEDEATGPPNADLTTDASARMVDQEAPVGYVARSASSGRAAPPSKMFTRGFFDDDSLFGSSSSESEDDSSDEQADDDASESGANQDKAAIPVTSEDGDVGEELEGDLVDETDKLLAELTFTDGLSTARKKGTDVPTNPLELAERQALNQNNSSRKSWASTKLLPIHDFDTLIPNPAMKFPFTLDDFQQQAVARLERSESVFVAAHTSAGKTVVAEYAVALAMQRATRCVYTSPIKALSNQKFRNLSSQFGAKNVGLITGDMQVNVDDSTCLIMTTEILRSMLYRGADLIRDIEWVVFDEVHYINDSERGVVWEEVIIMLPSYVNLIFLSATTPNTLEFSDWIGRTKRKSVHVIKTDYRPVPLSHNLWAGLQLHGILEGNGGFVEKGFSEATKALLPQSAKDPKKKGDTKRPASRATGSKQLAWQTQGSKQNWMSLVRYLDRELLTPAVIFSFSKKKCEEIANQLRSLDLNTAKERSAVQAFTIQTVARLSQSDSKLPQVLMICEMVQRGIGVHHGGLLPILKEAVEILFSMNLIKVLFATETFAMGVSMPCRSVVFNSIRKHDGTQFRVLEPGEYTQMAGRAGRRGIDKAGTVIVCCFGETPPPQPILRQMLTGSSTLLRSQFRLTYNMILNLLRVEEMSVESMIKRSFSEFATQRALTANEYPKLLQKGLRTLEKLDEQFEEDAATGIGMEDVEDYFSTCGDLLKTNDDLLRYVRENEADSLVDIFQPGRILLLTAGRDHGLVRAPAIVLRPPSSPGISIAATGRGGTSGVQNLVCMALLPESYVDPTTQSGKKTQPRPGSIGYVGSSSQRHYTIQEIRLDQVLLVTSTKHKIDDQVLLKDETKTMSHPGMSRQSKAFVVPSRGADNAFSGMMALGGKKAKAEGANLVSGAAKEGEAVAKAVGLLVEAETAEQTAGLPVLDLRSFVNRGSDAVHFRQACDIIDIGIAKARSSTAHLNPNIEQLYAAIERKETLREKVKTLQHLLSNESLELFPDFLQRKAVLRKLGYVDANETVSVKGRVACEVNTSEELIVTEMVFEGLLNDLEPEEIVAVLSALVYQDKSGGEELDAELPERLVVCCEQMKSVATSLGQLQKDQGLEVDPAEYCENSLKFGLVHVVYEWALGVPFKNICELTDVQEGSIVRCITRLDELCREVRNCARVVGSPTLYRKMEQASTSIKRDIVFASSLYVS